MVVVRQTDILIVGAGLIGTSLAVALQGQGIRIKILEHHLPSTTLATSVDAKPLTLSYGSYQILRTLDIWDDVSNEACPITTVHVSSQGALGGLRFRASEFNVPTLGYVIPFLKLQHTFYQRTALQKDTEIVLITAIEDIECDKRQVTVTFSTINGQQKLQADLLVAADGTHSTARRLLKIPVKGENRSEVALIVSLELEKLHNHTAYERFTSQGTLGILPLFQKNQCQLVWSLSKTKANEVEKWSDDQLCDAVQRIFKSYIGNIKSIKRGQRYPLQMLMAKEEVRPHVVLLGNAAHTLYPIVAQGFNLGLRDAAVLSEVLINAHQQLKSLGDISYLQDYHRQRKSDHIHTAGLTRSISQWFDVQVPLARQIRGFGLLTMGLFSPLKKRLAERLMGLSGSLPKLVRGLKWDDKI